MKYQKIRKPIVIATTILFHAFLVFHLLFSPVIIVLASSKGIVNASFISFCAILVLSLFFGRAYCSWFCPGCGMQEILGLFVKKRAVNTRATYIKYIIFSFWLAAIIIGYLLKGFKKLDFTYGMLDITVERKLLLTLGASLIIVPLTLIFGRFASCKYVCWQAPFMILGTKLRNALRLPGLRVVKTGECRSCKACTGKCPMNLDVMNLAPKGEISHPECILCGSCIEACKFKALSYRISIPARTSSLYRKISKSE